MKKKLAKALDQCLTRIRRGETIESCLRDYAGLEEDLAPLIFTALDLGAIPKITPTSGFRRESKARLLTLLREETARRTAIPAWFREALQTPTILWQHLSLTIAPMQKVFIPIFLVFTMIVIGSLSMSQIMPVPALAAQCTVSVLSGSIDVQQDGATEWLPGQDGMTLTAGTRVRTGADSHALLTFFEGSTLRMEPETDIEIREIARDKEEHITIVVMQYVGRTWSRVVKMAGTESHYSIDTPTASAMVRGTLFATEVAPDGMTRVATTEGLVSVIAQDEEVLLPPQQETSVSSGTPPAPVTTTPEPKATIRLNIDHPAIASIIDPTGASTGNLPGGISFNQIPGSRSTAPGSGSQVITIPHPVSGEYTVALRYLTEGSTHFTVQGISDSHVAFNYGGVYAGETDSGWLIKFNVRVEGEMITGSGITSVESLSRNAPEKITKPNTALSEATVFIPAGKLDLTKAGKGNTPLVAGIVRAVSSGEGEPQHAEASEAPKLPPENGVAVLKQTPVTPGPSPAEKPKVNDNSSKPQENVPVSPPKKVTEQPSGQVTGGGALGQASVQAEAQQTEQTGSNGNSGKQEAPANNSNSGKQEEPAGNGNSGKTEEPASNGNSGKQEEQDTRDNSSGGGGNGSSRQSDERWRSNNDYREALRDIIERLQDARKR